MEILIIVLIAVIVMQFITSKKKPSSSNEDIEAESKSLEKLPIAGAYQRKWLFSYNEKDAYKVLRPICDRYNLYLSSKVRLLDLVEPIKGNSKYKTYFWKIQAKHVDFVICDEKLVAKCIFELDDSSHNKADRKERDSFVDEVVQSVGYKIYHVKNIEPAAVEAIIKEIFFPNTEKETAPV
ncbi:MAG: DUF2726 domain-containing protein [Oscillibacter sp.]|nr:DUF2726 domain-containing protein [Oscillibacter sp.]